MSIALVDKFKSLSNDKKLWLIAGSVVVPLIVWSVASGNGKAVDTLKPNVDLTQSSTTNGLPPENVAAANEALQTKITNQQRELDEVKHKQDLPVADNPTSSIEKLAMNNRIAQLEEQIKVMNSGGASNPKGIVKNIPDLNSPININSEKVTPQSSLEPIEQPADQKLRIIKSAKPTEASLQNGPTKVTAYLPAGSNFEAILMNGMDAGTGLTGSQKPTPALLRVKTDAILPNLFKQDIRECFILVAAVGNMNSERAEMRTDTISCIAENGKTFEGKAEGYIVGEDGKVGARGRLVSKQGALLAKSLIAGFLSGIGGAMSPTQMPSLSLNSASGGSAGYQYPAPDYVLGSGVGKGVQTAGQQLSQFYIKLAQELFPIVEIDAGRKVTVILLKGLEIK